MDEALKDKTKRTAQMLFHEVLRRVLEERGEWE